ncbi:unnamed protein product [Linum trigynum]|uniref:Uncharacterized protein n=1 Tax=Linum trigynum TaxID=586398 RepID=A0AAV2EA50_9ROSI
METNPTADVKTTKSKQAEDWKNPKSHQAEDEPPHIDRGWKKTWRRGHLAGSIPSELAEMPNLDALPESFARLLEGKFLSQYLS